MKEKVFAGFYLEKLYFTPHFEPVIEELQRKGMSYVVIIPSNLRRDELDQQSESVLYCQKKEWNYCLADTSPELYFLIFANSPLEVSISYEKTVLIMHGTWGGKAVYLAPSLNDVDIRFIDGQFYEDILGHYYPDKKDKWCITGYSKLDSYFDYVPEDRDKLLKRCKLDVNKKTILYAPTFYPSSILNIETSFPEFFKDYNIIIKPHSNLFLRRRYRRTLKHINVWKKYSNVYVTVFSDTNLMPYMYAADIMISDISSAVYEFAAVGKPVVVNMFLRYRWWHCLFRKKIEKRLDKAHFDLWNVGTVVNSYPKMLLACRESLHHPELNRFRRDKYVKYVVGKVDGKVSERIVKKLQDVYNENIAVS